MPKEAPAKKNEKKTASKEKEEVFEERDRGELTCGDCPIARIFGFGGSISILGNMDFNQFFMHMASARKERMLGLRSLLDEAIRIEDEKMKKRQSTSGRKEKSKEQLRKIAID